MLSYQTTAPVTICYKRYDIEKQSVLLYWEPFPFLAMAGQRIGRSRFGFKMVLLAVLWCASHMKDLKAYQTLAVPGSGAPNKAELQKMTVPQLKEKLREKGKKVSGRKVELIERLLQRNIPKAGYTAIDDTDVFIPLDKTIQKLEELLEEERVVFIRAGVATGKSTLAEHLGRTQSSKYLQVHPPKTKKAFVWRELGEWIAWNIVRGKFHRWCRLTEVWNIFSRGFMKTTRCWYSTSATCCFLVLRSASFWWRNPVIYKKD